MNLPTARFDYAALDPETRRFVEERTERIHNLARMTAAGIVQIGQYLTEVKARLKHGNFLEWIEREFAWSEPSAERFMRVFRNIKSVNLTNLEIDVSALYLIAAPSIPEPVRTEVIRRAENGEPVTHMGARALVQRFVETGVLPEVEVSLPKMIEEARRRMFPQPPKKTAEERREEERLKEERKAGSARVAAVMTVIESIEGIADTKLTMSDIAHQIDRLDTPDQDWHGKARKACSRLKLIISELKK